jgi:Family of unknown function (DUF6893)
LVDELALQARQQFPLVPPGFQRRIKGSHPTAQDSIQPLLSKGLDPGIEGGLMKKPALNVTNLLAAAGLLFVGYVFLASLPDVRRYIRISTM